MGERDPYLLINSFRAHAQVQNHNGHEGNAEVKPGESLPAGFPRFGIYKNRKKSKPELDEKFCFRYKTGLKKFRGVFRYSARTRVIIEEKSVWIVQRMKNPAARSVFPSRIATFPSIRPPGAGSRLPKGTQLANELLDADTSRLHSLRTRNRERMKIQPLEKPASGW